MSDEFTSGVEYGRQLSKRIYYGNEVTAPPIPEPSTERCSPLESLLPSAMMVYAVVTDPEAVDNPDVPSYQPYVYGRSESPALVPLNMLDIEMEVECWLDTAFVTVTGSWRVHCIMTSKSCDCCVAVPMGEKGSVIGAEININGNERSYHTKLNATEDSKDTGKAPKSGSGRFLKSHIYTFRIPQVVGGSTLSIKVSWSQKVIYQDGQFCLDVPFSFPPYVNPVGKKIPKEEKILLNVNSSVEGEIVCKCISHPLTVRTREVGRLSMLYEAEVPIWSSVDFNFSYNVSSSNITGGVLLQSPSLHDYDDREMFCLYLLPNTTKNLKQVFRREVVFVIDISGSMQGSPLEDVKIALLASLSKLNPHDSFNVIAFNDGMCLFSFSMERATPEAILNASQWLDNNLVATGGTLIFQPLKQAMKLLANTTDAIPLIFLVTDGAVEDEREICRFIKRQLKIAGLLSPRICTFGIGLYCNHYFLQMLAKIGRGHYDSAYDGDSIELRIQRLFTSASSVIIANIVMDELKNVDLLELFPSNIPDISFGSPLVVSGRYKGEFPHFVKVSGTLADMSNFVTEVKVQRTKNMPINRVLAKSQIDTLTAHAWFSGSKELEKKVAIISLRSGYPSEYTSLILVSSNKEKTESGPVLIKEILNQVNILNKVDLNSQKIVLLGSVGVGFGNLSATFKNFPPGTEEPKSLEGAELLVKVATNCCSKVVDRVCCLCCIQTCSQMSSQCSIIVAQVTAALACFQCIKCCYELCECG